MKRKDVDIKNKSKRDILEGMKRYQKLKERLKSSFFNFKKVTWMDTSVIEIDNSITYNFIDLFSGAGGLSLGFKQANYTPLLGIEKDPDASRTYRNNFQEAEHFCEDIREISIQKIKEIIDDSEIHVLCAGFPCPGFSIAGERKPEDKRNYLYKEILRIIEAVKPWYLVLENVPGILTINNGKSVEKLREDFKQAGYPLSINILEAADYRTPQMRARAIFIGNRFGEKNPYPKPILEEEEYIPIEEAIDDLKDLDRRRNINHQWPKHSKETKEKIARVEAGKSLYSSYKDAYKRQRKGFPSMTVKENHGGAHIHHELDRVISAREMARLQGFPDSFIFVGRMKRVMWQVGNAVPVPLARHVALGLRPYLQRISEGF